MQVRPPPQPTSWSNAATGRSPSWVSVIDGLPPHVIVAFQITIRSDREAGAIVLVGDDRLRRPVGRRHGPVGVGRQDPRQRRIERDHVLVHEAGGLAGDHLVALEAPDSLAAGRVELRRGHRVRVLSRPDAELRIVVELRLVHEELVRAPAPGRVARIRDGDALVERALARAGEGELRNHPALRELVVEDDRVAVVVRAAERRAREDRVARGRGHDLGARLRVDGVVGVDPLHVVVGADVAFGVGRIAPAEVGDAVEGQVRARHPVLRRRPLDDRVARAAAGPPRRVALEVGLRDRPVLRVPRLQRPERRNAHRLGDADHVGR